MLQIRPINHPKIGGKWIPIKPPPNNNLIDIKASIANAGIQCSQGLDIRFIREKKLLWQISANPEDLSIVKLTQKDSNLKQLALPLKLFYFINASLGPEKFEEIFKAHLAYIRISGVCRAENFKLTIVCVAEPEALKKVLEIAKESLPHLFDTTDSNKSCPRFKLIVLPHSIYERDCLSILWKDAINTHEETVYCYAHGKGVASRKTKGRKKVEAIFSSVILKRLESCTHLLNTFPNSSKLSGCFSPQGFAWHNFWLAKGSYLKKLEKPPITSNRYFYEYWLSGMKPCDESISNGEISETCSRGPQHHLTSHRRENITLMTLPSQFNLGGTATRKKLNDYVMQEHENMLHRAISGLWPI